MMEGVSDATSCKKYHQDRKDTHWALAPQEAPPPKPLNSSCEDYLIAASPPNSQLGLLISSFMLLPSAVANWAATGACWKHFRPAEPSPAKRHVRGTAQAYPPVHGRLWPLRPNAV